MTQVYNLYVVIVISLHHKLQTHALYESPWCNDNNKLYAIINTSTAK